MRKGIIAIVCVFSIISNPALFAQDSNPEAKEEFKPSGKIIARGFLDFSTGLSSNTNEETGIDITRAFLGYNYRITQALEAQVIIDGASGKSSSGSSEVYLRNAFLRWRDQGFDISVGQIGLMQFSTQEAYWKHRYVMKSFQDLNKMAPSVDLGATVSYAFSPYISADVSYTNGEGYKKVEKNNSARYAAGISLFPFKGAILRVYGDIYNESEDLREDLPEGITDADYKNQYSLSLFAGYQNEVVSGGAEYNRMYNKGFIEKKDYYGYSFYASGKVAKRWRVFARYDLMDSSKPSNFTDPWNKLDGQLMMAGVEFQPLKQVKIAPNFRNINPDRGKSEQYVFVNLEFNL